MSDHYDDEDFRALFHVAENDRRGGKDSGEIRPNPNYQRLKDFANLLLDAKPGMRILEIGGGRGGNLVPIAFQGPEVVNIDINADDVERSRRHFEHFDIKGEGIVGSATKLDQFADSSFDAVFSSDFHEHLTPAEQVEALTEALRVLRPGGRIVIKTPNLRYLTLSLQYKRIRAALRGRNPRGYVIAHTPGTDDPQHVGLTTRSRMSEALLAAGFQTYAFQYAPLTRWGRREVFDVLSTEIPGLRDWLCEEVFCVAWKPINISYFPL